MTTINLLGKTAIVTGAGTGLGRITASLLHEAGANVIVNYFSGPDGTNQKNAEEVVNELGNRAQAMTWRVVLG